MFDQDSHLIFEAYTNNYERLFWQAPNGELISVGDNYSHAQAGIYILRKIFKDKRILNFALKNIMSNLYKLNYNRVVFTPNTLWFNNDETPITLKQLKELKDIAIERGLKLKNSGTDKEVFLD